MAKANMATLECNAKLLTNSTVAVTLTEFRRDAARFGKTVRVTAHGTGYGIWVGTDLAGASETLERAIEDAAVTILNWA